MKKSIDQDFLSLAAAKHDVKRLVSDRMDSIIGTWRKQILKKTANQDTAKIVTDEEMRRRLGELVKKVRFVSRAFKLSRDKLDAN